MSEDAIDVSGPTISSATPAGTPCMTPTAVLKRSTSSMKEKVAGLKQALRGKKGAGVSPRPDSSVSTTYPAAMRSRSRRVKKVAATLRQQIAPMRASRGEHQPILHTFARW